MIKVQLNPYCVVDDEHFSQGISFINSRLKGLGLRSTNLPSDLMRQMIDDYGGKVMQYYGFASYPWAAEAIVGLKTGKTVFEDYWVKFGFRPKVSSELRLTGQVEFYVYLLNSHGEII
ncbi:MAG: hypothetical protein ABF586_08235 [Sporolactobacillus sp.]